MAEMTRCSSCGNPSGGFDRCVEDGLYLILTAHGDFQTDHDGHEEFDCRDSVYAFVNERIRAAVTQVLNDAADELVAREKELRSLLRRRAALTPAETTGMANGFRDAARIVRARVPRAT